MTRGIRGATTVPENDKDLIIAYTKELLEKMIAENDIHPSNVSHIFISATKDINAAFPAQALRKIEGWKYVPVMCMSEMDVPNSLSKCIRIMMVVDTERKQEEINHVFLHDAVQLRPDLVKGD